MAMTTAGRASSTPSADSGDPAIASVTDATGRLAARMIIDRAKGQLMTNRGMTEPEAYRWIQKNAMDRRTPMAVISGQILDGLGDAAIAS
jgi:AmiR/NasT family two-component response regulator